MYIDKVVIHYIDAEIDKRKQQVKSLKNIFFSDLKILDIEYIY